MEKRSAARELAFLALFQLPKNPEKLAKTDFHAICLSALRTLSDYSKSNINKAEAYFLKAERALMEYQINHEENEPLEEGTRAVPLPKTDEFFDHLNNCYRAVALLRESLEIPELYFHYQDSDIQEFTLTLIMNFVDAKTEVHNLIKDTAPSWDISRMSKIDRTIMEIAVTEMIKSNIQPAIVVSEALKIANKYSTPEGVKFINGVLADVVKALGDKN